MSKHKCEGPLYACWDHARPVVWKGRVTGLWWAENVKPGDHFPTHAEAIQYATSRARAEALAAVQSAEGVTAR